MKKNLGLTAATGLFGLVVLAGCGSSADTQSATSAPAGSSAGGSGGGSSAALQTAKTSLGTIVVNGKGMSIYYFDKDVANSGASACYEGCASLWPPVTTTSKDPAATGVTGKIGTITRKDGSLQVTVNGMPVYLYAADTAAGDVNGQGVKDIWWVLGPKGDKITQMASKPGY